MKCKNIRDFLIRYERGEFNSDDFKIQVAAGWYDWFCDLDSLQKRLHRLVTKLNQIVDSPKINTREHYVFFKNNFPLYSTTYDDFRICDVVTGEVLYTITPSCGRKSSVWGKENAFTKPLVSGSWNDVVKFFN